MATNNSGEPSTAPQPNRWYELRLGSSCHDPSPTAKYCTLRYEFKPASIDKTQAGSLQKTKDNRVTVEFHNNQPGKPKVAFKGSQEEYKDNDGVLFFDGETFRLERLHRAVKRLRHVRVPGESGATALAATTTGLGESHSPPLAKVGKSPGMNKPVVHSIPVEVERIDIGGEPENPGPRKINRSSTSQPARADPFSLSPGPDEQDENLEIIGDDGNSSLNNIASGQGESVRGFDINVPSQFDMDDEIADVDVNDESDEGLNAAEALRAQVNAEGQQEEQDSSSSSGSSGGSSSGSGSASGSSSSDSDGSDGDSASSGGDVDI